VDSQRAIMSTAYYHTSEQMPEVKDASAEIAIASPPFTNHPDGITLQKVEYLEFIQRVFTELLRTLTPTGILVCINTDLRDHARYNRRDTQFDGLIWQKHCDIRRVAECVGFRCFDTKIWAKSLKQDAYRYMFAYIQFFRKADAAARRSIRGKTSDAFGADVWLLMKGTYRRDSRGFVFRDAIHPGIVSRCLDRFTQPGDLVISPFAGSGTIPAVARLLARNCVGYEINTKLRPLIEESIKTPERFPAYLDLLNTTERVSSRT
jgi:modification methylase